jgi:four helix bundle protein
MAERGFEGLDCYQLALHVFREAYRVAKQLPDIERYNLADQLRRAATSVTLNIAEGYGRYHYLDKIRFYYVARGSLTESQAAFIACQAAGYTTDEALVRQRDLCHRALQALNGLIRYTYKQRQGQKEYGDRALRESETEYTIISDIRDGLTEFPNPKSTNNGD